MQIKDFLQKNKQNMINDLAKIISYDSVAELDGKSQYPFGDTTAQVLDETLKIFEREGLTTKNVDYYAGYGEIGEGEKLIGILAHLDIVPCGKGWTSDPLTLTIRDGKMFGRGVTDDKGPVICALYAMKYLKESGVKLDKRIRVIFGLNEETGGADIEYYLSKEKPPVAAFTPDADYPIINGEKGLTGFNLLRKFENLEEGKITVEKMYGGQAGNIVPDSCSIELKCEDIEDTKNKIKEFAKENSFEIELSEDGNILKAKCIGVSAHASTPEMGLNAIMIAVKLAVTLDVPCDDMGVYLRFLNDKIGFNLHGEAFGCYLEDEISGKLSFNVGIIDLNRESANLRLDVRYPVTKVLDDMLIPFNKTLEGTGIETISFSHSEPLYFDAENELVKKLQKVYSDITNEEATLISIGGGTYAKSMPNTLAFGPEFPGDENTNIHKPNEFIKIENLVKNAKIYAKALYELAK